MTWNSGAGRPLWFRCRGCRSTLSPSYEDGRGYASDVKLTGRTKPSRTKGQVRHGTTSREYRCNACGHVGWSSHNDLASKVS